MTTGDNSQQEALARLAALAAARGGSQQDGPVIQQPFPLGSAAGRRANGTLDDIIAARKAQQAEPSGLSGVLYDVMKTPVLGDALEYGLKGVDYGRSFMVSAVNEGADALGQLASAAGIDAYDTAKVSQFGENFDPAAKDKLLSEMSQGERKAYVNAGNELNDRQASFGDLFRQAGEHVGFGQVIEGAAPTAPQWAKVVGGIAGDVLLDPLTWMAPLGKAGLKVSAEGAEIAAEAGLREAYAQGGREVLSDAVSKAATLAGKEADDSVQRLIKEVGQRGRGGLTDAAYARAGVSKETLRELGIDGLERTVFGKHTFGGRGAKALTEGIEASKGAAKRFLGGTGAAKYYRAARMTDNALADIVRDLDSPAARVAGAVRASGIEKGATMTSSRWGAEWHHVATKRFKAIEGFTKMGKDARQGVTHTIEAAGRSGDAHADEVIQLLGDIRQSMSDMGIQVADTFGEKYVPHVATKDARKLAMKNVKLKELLDRFDNEAFFLQKRADNRTIKEINDLALADPEIGIKILEDDITDILGIYMGSAEKQVNRHLVQQGLEEAGYVVERAFTKARSVEQELAREQTLAVYNAAKDTMKVKLKDGREIRLGTLRQVRDKVAASRKSSMTKLAKAQQELLDAQVKAAKVAERVTNLEQMIPQLEAHVAGLQQAAKQAKGAARKSAAAKARRAATQLQVAQDELRALNTRIARGSSPARLQAQVANAEAKLAKAQQEAEGLFPDPEPTIAQVPLVKTEPVPAPVAQVAPQAAPVAPAAALPTEPVAPAVAAVDPRVLEGARGVVKEVDDLKAELKGMEKALVERERTLLDEARAAAVEKVSVSDDPFDVAKWDSLDELLQAKFATIDRTELDAVRAELKAVEDQIAAASNPNAATAGAVDPEKIAALQGELDATTRAWEDSLGDKIDTYYSDDWQKRYTKVKAAASKAQENFAVAAQKGASNDELLEFRRLADVATAELDKMSAFEREVVGTDIYRSMKTAEAKLEAAKVGKSTDFTATARMTKKQREALEDEIARLDGELAKSKDSFAKRVLSKKIDELEAKLAADEAARDAAQVVKGTQPKAEVPDELLKKKAELDKRVLAVENKAKKKAVKIQQETQRDWLEYQNMTPERRAEMVADRVRAAKHSGKLKDVAADPEKVAAARAEVQQTIQELQAKIAERAEMYDAAKKVLSGSKNKGGRPKKVAPEPAPAGAAEPVAQMASPEPVGAPVAASSMPQAAQVPTVDPAALKAVQEARAAHVAKAQADLDLAKANVQAKAMSNSAEVAEATIKVNNLAAKLAEQERLLDDITKAAPEDWWGKAQKAENKWAQKNIAGMSKNLKKDRTALTGLETLTADAADRTTVLNQMITDFNNTPNFKGMSKAEVEMLRQHVTDTVAWIDSLNSPEMRAQFGDFADLLIAQEQHALMADLAFDTAKSAKEDMQRMLNVMDDPQWMEVFNYQNAPNGWTNIGEKYQMENWLADAMGAQIKMSDPEVFGKFVAGLRKTQNLWKGMATSRPGFLLRNMISSSFNMYLEAGARSFKHLGDMMRFMRLRAEHPENYMELAAQAGLPVDKLNNALSVVTGSGSGQVASEFATSFGRGMTVNPLKADFVGYRGVRTLNEMWETSVRGAHAMAVLERGGTPIQALDVVNKWHFNYRDITKFDRRAKDFAPFWMFFSNNVALQAHIWTHELPKLNRTFMNIKRNTENESQRDDATLPIYLQGSLMFGGNKTGEDTNFYDIGLPSMQFMGDVATAQNNPLAMLGSQISPFLTVPAEGLFNRDTLTGREFDSAGQFVMNNALPAVVPYLGAGQRFADEQKRNAALIAFLSGVGTRTVTPEQRYYEQVRQYDERYGG